MKYFIATPTSSEKSYAETEWANSIKSLVTSASISYEVAISDNSPTADYSNQLKSLIAADMKSYPQWSGLELDSKLVNAHEELRKRFLTSDCDVFLSWESDITAEPSALVTLDSYMKSADVVMCSYPDKFNAKQNICAMGFTAFSRAVIEEYAFDYLGGYGEIEVDSNTVFGSDGWILYRARLGGAKIIQLTNVIALGHI